MAESFSIVIRIKKFFTMKLHNIFILIALFFIASACSSSQPTVATDKDIQEGDFQQYETFTFTKQVLSNDDNQYFENSEALKKTVMNEIKNELQAMGYKYNENEGDLLVNARIFTEDTEYTFRVYDRFGCEVTTDVFYESIVTEAKFTVDPQGGEAPLIVEFNNQSENGDPGFYEWFFYRDLDEIKRESEDSEQPIDSIDLVVFDDNPVYTFENSGTYNIKLVSKHVSENLTCVDTTFIDEFIVVDTSFIAVPNVFTPNGDGTNDEFVVKFWSMESIKISIFNRWGKRIHFWENGNIRGFEDTYEETVWDGQLGGRWASPGVYYYTVEGTGRDDKKRRAHGFFHLFRDKR